MIFLAIRQKVQLEIGHVNHSLTMPVVLLIKRRTKCAAMRIVSEKLTMNAPEVLDVARDAIWLTIAMSAPVMLVGLAVGLVIGLLQALTQIQEQTLVFVPKILAIFAALLFFLPLMGGLMGDFMTQMMSRVASGGAG
jgi:flagellar biosynthesis protein FliQ